MNRPLVITALITLVSVLFLAMISGLAPPFLHAGDAPVKDPQMVEIEGANSTLWPYLSTHRGFQQRSPINLLVPGATVQEVTDGLRGLGWNHTPLNLTDAGPEAYTLIDANQSEGADFGWGQARGSNRFAYVSDGEQSTWKRQDEQLHDGDYFGHRLHVRLYASPIDGEWVAMQAHTEHFDWFTLRHAVDGVAEAQLHIEQQFMGQPFVEEVWRKHLGNPASDADGWATVIELAMLPGVVALAIVPATLKRHLTDEDLSRLARFLDEIGWPHLWLGLSIMGLVLGTRLTGILLEGAPWLSLPPKVIAGSLFPILATGVPVAAYVGGAWLERRIHAGTVASMAFGAASIVDYSLLGVDTLPLTVVLHRAVLVTAVGMIAAGAAKRARREAWFNAMVLTGLGLWTGALAASLFGWL